MSFHVYSGINSVISVPMANGKHLLVNTTAYKNAKIKLPSSRTFFLHPYQICSSSTPTIIIWPCHQPPRPHPRQHEAGIASNPDQTKK